MKVLSCKREYTMKPSLCTDLKTYNLGKLSKDLISGIIVGIIAIPLSIALAIKSGATPAVGLLTGIVAGALASLFSGARHQITGTTAFVTIIISIMAEYGQQGLIVATFLGGAILVIMGILRFGKLVKYIDSAIVVGFTSGVAVVLFVGQLGDFLGLKTALPINFIDKVMVIFSNMWQINWMSVLFGVISLVIIFGMPQKIRKIVPSTLAAIVATSGLYAIFRPNIATIGSTFGVLTLRFDFMLDFSGINFLHILKPALNIALLGAIESLLSATAIDKMTGYKYNPNMELVAQGIANMGNSLFGALPATGAIARSSANVRSGGVTSLSGVFHAITLLLAGLFLMPLISYIPLTALASVLFMVCKNMFNKKNIAEVFARKWQAKLLFFVTLCLTILFDLVVAIFVGVTLSMLFKLAPRLKSLLAKNKQN